MEGRLLEVGQRLADLGAKLMLYVTLPILVVAAFVIVVLHIRRRRCSKGGR